MIHIFIKAYKIYKKKIDKSEAKGEDLKMEQTLLNHKRYKSVYKYVLKKLLTLKNLLISKNDYYGYYHSFFSSKELRPIVNEFEAYKNLVKQMNEKTNMNTLILRHQLLNNCCEDIVGYFMTFNKNNKLIELKDVLKKKQEMYEIISRILANKANIILHLLTFKTPVFIMNT